MFILVIFGLSGCATATGPAFTELLPVSSQQGNVYIYRKFALFATAGAYDVNINGKHAGKLPNSSYLMFSLQPGRYLIDIDGMNQPRPSFRVLNVEAGKNYFLQFDVSGSSFNPGRYVSTFTDIRKFDERSEGQAIADMSGMKRAN